MKHKILPNLVISSRLWWILHVLLANQNREIFWMNNNSSCCNRHVVTPAKWSLSPTKAPRFAHCGCLIYGFLVLLKVLCCTWWFALTGQNKSFKPRKSWLDWDSSICFITLAPCTTIFSPLNVTEKVSPLPTPYLKYFWSKTNVYNILVLSLTG